MIVKLLSLCALWKCFENIILKTEEQNCKTEKKKSNNNTIGLKCIIFYRINNKTTKTLIVIFSAPLTKLLNKREALKIFQ